MAGAVGLALCAARGHAQVDRDMNPSLVRRAATQAAAGLPAVEADWRRRFHDLSETEANARELFGFSPPGLALQVAFLHAFLFQQEGRDEDARRAIEALRRMAAYRDEVPAELFAERVEYAGGLPAVPSFFQLAEFCESYARVRDAAVVTEEDRRVVEAAIAGSADFVFVFPEWGAHNRAMLRAESLVYAALAVPDHAHAARWRALADTLARDSLHAWEIEDAQGYHPIWLWALLRYAEATGREDVLRSIPVRYYLRYFLALLAPSGEVPDFGDAWWGGARSWYYQCLEWGAALWQDPELRWAAGRVYSRSGAPDADHLLGPALLYARLAGRMDPTLAARAPVLASGPVLDDLIGKKVVFRTGVEDDATYLLLNYRDEGDWGLLARDNLRQTLAVAEEKMHHGHADENSIVLLMDRGSVLLHDAGYRERMPSGPYGAFRADLFHNRLVMRAGRPAPGQGTLEFLRDEGAYRPVRTQQIDFVPFQEAEFSRTRVTDLEAGSHWDRTIVFLREPRVFVVLDSVRMERPGEWTLATLWAGGAVRARGPGYAVTFTDHIGETAVPHTRDLALVFPDVDGVPDVFPLRRHGREERVVHECRRVDFEAGQFASLVTILRPVAVDAEVNDLRAACRRVETSVGDRAVAVQVTVDGEEWWILLKTDLTLGLRDEDVRPRYDPATGSVQAGPIDSDADLVVLCRRGDDARWAATNMTRVAIDGTPVFASAPLNLFQTSGRSDVVGRVKWRSWEGQVGDDPVVGMPDGR